MPIDPVRDAASCARMHREMYLASFGTDEGLEEEMGPADSRYLAQLEEKVRGFPEGNVHLRRGEAILGQLEMRLLDEEPGVSYLSLIHLVPEARGQGLAELLHRHAIEVSKARGCKRMRLSVSRRNRRAIAFYERHGWRANGTRPHRMPVLVMELPLGG